MQPLLQIFQQKPLLVFESISTGSSTIKRTPKAAAGSVIPVRTSEEAHANVVAATTIYPSTAVKTGTALNTQTSINLADTPC